MRKEPLYLEYLDMEYTGKEIANLMKISYSRSEQIKHDIRFRLNLVQDVSTLLAEDLNCRPSHHQNTSNTHDL